MEGCGVDADACVGSGGLGDGLGYGAESGAEDFVVVGAEGVACPLEAVGGGVVRCVVVVGGYEDGLSAVEEECGVLAYVEVVFKVVHVAVGVGGEEALVAVGWDGVEGGYAAGDCAGGEDEVFEFLGCHNLKILRRL